jgi:hypothetical protein
MNSLIIGVLSGLTAVAVIRLITRKNTRGNEFHLYRLYSAYEGSDRSSTVGVFSDMAKAGEAQKNYEQNPVPGIYYGINKVIVNTYRGREGNTVYEWKAGIADPGSYFFFTRSDYLEELKKMLTRANEGGQGELQAFEIDG